MANFGLAALFRSTPISAWFQYGTTAAYSDEDEINIHGTHPKRADSDGDGLTDPAEIQTHLTNPNIADTDNDGLSDGAEVTTSSRGHHGS